jgi:hypothetical protein
MNKKRFKKDGDTLSFHTQEEEKKFHRVNTQNYSKKSNEDFDDDDADEFFNQ